MMPPTPIYHLPVKHRMRWYLATLLLAHDPGVDRLTTRWVVTGMWCLGQYEVTMLLSTMEDSVEMEPVLPSSGRYKEEEEETKGQRHGDLWEDR